MSYEHLSDFTTDQEVIKQAIRSGFHEDIQALRLNENVQLIDFQEYEVQKFLQPLLTDYELDPSANWEDLRNAYLEYVLKWINIDDDIYTVGTADLLSLRRTKVAGALRKYMVLKFIQYKSKFTKPDTINEKEILEEVNHLLKKYEN